MDVPVIISVLSDLITLSAVGVALYFGHRQRGDALEARYDALRPVIAPEQPPQEPYTAGGGAHDVIERPRDPLFDLTRQGNLVRLTNVGAGVAMNVRGVVFGPEPTMPQGMPPAIHSLSAAAPIPPGQSIPVVAKRGFSGLKVQGTDSFVPGYTVYAPAPERSKAEAAERGTTASTVQFRLTLTYHDLFGRIHGSVYDHTGANGWEAREPARQITKDLDGALSRARHQGPRGWLWRRGRGQTPARRLGRDSRRGSTCGPARRDGSSR